MSELSNMPPTAPRMDFADEAVTPDPALFEEVQNEPAFSRHVLTSPLHLSVARASRSNLWEPWNGITAAQVLSSIDDECLALHTRATIADISPLAKYRIAGRDAKAYLARLLTDNVSSQQVGDVRQVLLCEEAGLLVGDGDLFRLDEMEYRLITERSHLAWLTDNQAGFRVKVEDASASLAALRVAGPLSARLLEAAGFETVETLQENSARWCRPNGSPAYVSRSDRLQGHYNIWVDRDDAGPLWTHLMRTGEPLGLTPIGRCVSELARVEAGALREGHDYMGALYAAEPRLASTPFDLGWEDRVDLAHGVFNGRAALRRMAGTPTLWTYLHVQFEAERGLAFKTLNIGSDNVGILTSCVFSLLLNSYVGIARVLTSAAKSNRLHALAEGRATERSTVPVSIVGSPATGFNRSSV